jgi:hypothetical protein
VLLLNEEQLFFSTKCDLLQKKARNYLAFYLFIRIFAADYEKSRNEKSRNPTSTIYSALKRLQKDGYVIYSDHYEIEDPFFKEWVLRGM